MKYIVELVKLRREVEGACHKLINDEKIADLFYREIMFPLEDMLEDDCELIED